jgi:anaerobic magnesium-protoporphyrin IX monomethyl ester cyclase
MKVLLVAPYRPCSTGSGSKRQDIAPSEALLTLYSVLREAGHSPIMRNFTTTGVEAMSDPLKYSYDSILEIINKEHPPLIGISFLFGGDFPYAYSLAQFIKKNVSDVKIITGGIHPTTFPREILLNAPEFDYIAIGEGENQILEIANRMEASDLSNLEEISGFAFRDSDGLVKVNEKREFVDYNSLPMPAWDMIDFREYEIDLSNYYNPKGHELKNIVNLFSERGCPFRCTFCDLYLMQGRKLRRLSTEKFINGLKYLVNERGQRYFRFQDDNFLVDNRHVINICNEIVKCGLDIQFDMAGGHVASYNDDVIDHLVEAGMVSTILNIEHASEYIRNKVIKKFLSHDKIFSVVESMRRHRVQLGTNWIMGFPEDTNETLQETYALIEALKPDRANVGTLIPFPGTPIFDQCVRDDLFIEKINIDDYWKTPFRPHQHGAVIKPYKMNLDELSMWREKFIDIRYKYFGHYHKELFKLPIGYKRCDNGVVRLVE